MRDRDFIKRYPEFRSLVCRLKKFTERRR
jgi:hypothetical protein